MSAQIVRYFLLLLATITGDTQTITTTLQMLRVTGLSLLLGSAAFVAVLYIIFLPGETHTASPPALVWSPPVAEGQANPNPRRIVLNKYGGAVVSLPQTTFAADHYPYLHLSLQEVRPKATIILAWRIASDPDANYTHKFETTERESLWVATSELPGWEGTIESVHLIIAGEADAAITVDAFELHQPGLVAQLRGIYSDLTAYEPWNRSSMNSHTGARRVSAFYPAPLFAGFFLSCLGAYLVLCLTVPRIQFAWSVTGLIFLSIWICLDLVWHKRLVDQVADTQATFAGKSDDQKLRIGPDAALYQFVRSASEAIPRADARVFVASSDDYTGLRAAYYFYPLNALWRLQTDEIPQPHFLRSGDYLALLNPTTVELNAQDSTATFSQGSLVVDTLVSEPAGTLVRVR